MNMTDVSIRLQRLCSFLDASVGHRKAFLVYMELPFMQDTEAIMNSHDFLRTPFYHFFYNRDRSPATNPKGAPHLT